MRRRLTQWKRRENESTEIYYQFKDVMRYCILIDWVGGPDGKVFGSRSWRTYRAQHRGPSAITESQIFPIQPNVTQSLSILSYDFQVLEIGRPYTRPCPALHTSSFTKVFYGTARAGPDGPYDKIDWCELIYAFEHIFGHQEIIISRRHKRL